jgi:transcriptional regulator with XRE-family HTH domain
MIFSPLEGRAHRMGMLDVDCLVEIKRTLRRFQFDPAFRGNGNRVPLRQFAELCGVSRQTIYDLVRGDRKGIEPSTRDRILNAIELVTQHGLRWKRIAVRKPVVERRVIDPGLIEWTAVMPNGKPAPPIPQRHRTQARA